MANGRIEGGHLGIHSYGFRLYRSTIFLRRMGDRRYRSRGRRMTESWWRRECEAARRYHFFQELTKRGLLRVVIEDKADRTRGSSFRRHRRGGCTCRAMELINRSLNGRVRPTTPISVGYPTRRKQVPTNEGG